jgi:hypothetical protein
LGLIEQQYMIYQTRKCVACIRKSCNDLKYCTYHYDAFLNLKQKYESWVYAYGHISWQEYMNKLLLMSEVGIWVRDVVAIETKNLS